MRYIDADALKSRMFNYYDCINEQTSKSNYSGETLMAYEVADMIEDCIDNAPTADVVAVVRCKDCKYFHTCSILWESKEQKENGYCSLGERREP